MQSQVRHGRNVSFCAELLPALTQQVWMVYLTQELAALQVPHLTLGSKGHLTHSWATTAHTVCNLLMSLKCNCKANAYCCSAHQGRVWVERLDQ